jgi:prepilin-type N-terminal cleavage/methylation domain-containing protein
MEYIMTNPIANQIRGKSKTGFSLIEMIIVIAILGVLMAIAIPTYLSVLPGVELKSDARTIMFALQRARQAASSYNRPTRFLLDCSPATINPGGHRRPCRIAVEMAVYDDTGAIRQWAAIQSGKMELSPFTRFQYVSNFTIKRDQYDSYQNFFKNFQNLLGGDPRTYGVFDKDDFNGDSVVVVYIPNGEAVTYCKVKLNLVTDRKPTLAPWSVDVINSTGYVRLHQEKA